MWDSARSTAADSMLSVQLAGGTADYADRCIDIMRRAYSNAHIEIANRRVGMGFNTAVVDVQGIRSDVAAAGTTPRDIAAQCRFDHGAMVDFHWTAGPWQ
jgi:hypothetical protein